MNRLKDLQEKRGAKLKEAATLVQKATAEKRELTADENQKLASFHDEAENLSAGILNETRQLALEGQRPAALNEREQRDVGSFDFQKLLRHMHANARGASVGVIDGIEAEMIQEGEKEARDAGIRAGGIILPRLLVRRNIERRDVTATGTTTTSLDQGGMTIATTKSGLLDDFYNASIIRQAGATVLEGLTGNLDLPRLTAGTAPAGKAENAAADETSPLTAMLSLSPNRLPAYVDISERLLMQSSVAIEAVLRRNLTAQMSAIQEAAFFHGTGTNEANGIAGTSGIGSVVGGTDGAAPTWAHLVELETDVDTQNALLGSLRYISNGQIRGKLKTTPKVASTDSMMIIDDRAGGLINGYGALWTNAVSRTLTKGGSSVASAIFFGNFADYYIGYWSGISLEMVRDKTNAISGLYTLVASAYYDGGVVRPKSFSAMLDALGA